MCLECFVLIILEERGNSYVYFNKYFIGMDVDFVELYD